MSLTPGSRLGPYEVLTQIGVGGMGEVYRATDTNLKRQVAIKVLPASVAGDAERLARFQREAELLAALNHPNVAQIYGLEKSPATGSGQAGVHALVMELVEGPTLADLLVSRAGPSGPAGLPLDEVLPIARQIAEALESAHERGIIHRDLKPANIKVREDGTVKVLDFGLAKAMDAVGSGQHAAGDMTPSMAATITSPALMTGAGMILGTAAYMSPEQAKGRPVDKRADIWAFGCVLYEMLTGTSLFASESVAESLGLIFSREPDLAALPAGTPAGVRTLIARCLVRDPRQRLRDIGDARLTLDGAFDTPSAPPPVAHVAGPVWRRVVPIVAAVAATALAVGLGVWTLTRPTPPQIVRLTMAHPAPEVVGGNQFDANVTLSPDGRQVAYVASLPSSTNSNTLHLYVRALDEAEPRPLSSSARSPFFSPDGQWVGFVEDNRWLSKVALAGGPSTHIAEIGNGIRGASWGADDSIVFATLGLDTGLSRVPASGGVVEVLTKPDASKGEVDHLYPELLPGGRAILFTISFSTEARDSKIAVLDLTTRSYRIVLDSGSYATYSPSGHVLVGGLGVLRAIPFDLSALAVRGTAVPMESDVLMSSAGAAQFAFAAGGTLVKVRGRVLSGLASTLAWVDRTGRVEPLTFEPRQYSDLALSPDGSRVAARIDTNAGGTDSDLWVLSLVSKSASRLTFEPGTDQIPLWTPDGAKVVYRVATQGLFWRPADGTGNREPFLVGVGNGLVPDSWSPDGSLIFENPQPGRQTIAMVSARAGARTPVTLLTASERFGLAQATLSPDGRWLAYMSNESGRTDVYVRPFPAVDSGKWQVTSSGGATGISRGILQNNSGSLRWTADSRAILFSDATGIMASRIADGPTFSASTPERVLTRPLGMSVDFDMSPDGSRFLMRQFIVGDDDTTQIEVVLNWLDELKRLVP
ncbi:MAG: protein kinase [Vicinamibacterales bacterium]